MNKCCKNCKHDCLWTKNGVVRAVQWDTSKDYCSKWEEKEDIFWRELDSFFKINGYDKLHVMGMISKRVKESLDDTSLNLSEKQWKDIEKNFDWLGIEWE